MEIFSPQEDLKRQMGFNESQLHHLYSLAKGEKLNFWLHFSIATLLVLIFCFFLYIFLVKGVETVIREEIVQLSGAICVL